MHKGEVSSIDLANHWLNLDLSDRSPAYFNALQKSLAPQCLSNNDRWKLRAQILVSRRKASRGTGTKHTRLLQYNENKLHSDIDASSSSANIIQQFRDTPLYKSENKHQRESMDIPSSAPEIDISPAVLSAITSTDSEEPILPYSRYTWDSPSLNSMVDESTKVVNRPSINASRNKTSVREVIFCFSTEVLILHQP